MFSWQLILTCVSDLFSDMKVEITALSSYEEKEENFKEEVLHLNYYFFIKSSLEGPSTVAPIVSGNFGFFIM